MPSKPGEVGTPAIKFADTDFFSEKPTKTKAALEPGDIGPPDHDAVDADEEKLQEKRLVRRWQRAGHPGKLEGSEAETFVEKKKVELSVDAIVELEIALKYGSEGARERARDRILDATGHGRREKGNAAANLIVINMGGGNGVPPPLPYADVVDAVAKALPK